VFDVTTADGNPVKLNSDDVVTIVFNHSFNHQSLQAIGDNVAPNMMFIRGSSNNILTVDCEGTTLNTYLSGNELPVYYRFEYNADTQHHPAPIIGIDPLTHEKYAIGLQNAVSPHNTNPGSNLCAHSFIYRTWSAAQPVNYLRYGSGSNYSAIYEGNDTEVSYYSYADITYNVNGSNNKFIAAIRNGFGPVCALHKIGHFDTVHSMQTVNGVNVIGSGTAGQLQEITAVLNDLAQGCGMRDAYLVMRMITPAYKDPYILKTNQEYIEYNASSISHVDDDINESYSPGHPDWHPFRALDYVFDQFNTTYTTFDQRVNFIKSLTNKVWANYNSSYVTSQYLSPVLGTLPTSKYGNNFGRVLVLNTPHARWSRNSLIYDYTATGGAQDNIATMRYMDVNGTPGAWGADGNIDPFIYSKDDLEAFFADKTSDADGYYYYAGLSDTYDGIYSDTSGTGTYATYKANAQTASGAPTYANISSPEERWRVNYDSRHGQGNSGNNAVGTFEPWKNLVESDIAPADIEKGYRLMKWAYHPKPSTGPNDHLCVFHAILHIFEEDECECCHPRVFETTGVTNGVYDIRPVSGDFPMRENDEFSVIFNHECKYDANNPNKMVFLKSANGEFGGNDMVACFYKDMLRYNYGDPYPAPILHIDPVTENQYVVNNYTSQYDAVTGSYPMGSGNVHKFMYKICKNIIGSGVVYDYGTNHTYRWLSLYADNGEAIDSCSEVETNTSTGYDYRVYQGAVKIGDFRSVEAGGGGTGIQGIQGIQGLSGSGSSSLTVPRIKNLKFSPYLTESNMIATAEAVEEIGKATCYHKVVSDQIKFQMSAPYSWMTANILTNNGALPATGGVYGVRFERIKRGKWMGINCNKTLSSYNPLTVCAGTQSSVPQCARYYDGTLEFLGTMEPSSQTMNRYYAVHISDGDYAIYQTTYNSVSGIYKWRLVNYVNDTSYMYIPFNSTNMDCAVSNIGTSEFKQYIFTMKKINTMSLMNAVTVRAMDNSLNHIYSYEDILKNGAGEKILLNPKRTVYIGGTNNATETYLLRAANSRYSYNRTTADTNIGITNRLSVRFRICFVSYDSFADYIYYAITPFEFNSIEFNLLLGMTRNEDESADNETSFNNSQSNLPFVRGKLSRGRIPF